MKAQPSIGVLALALLAAGAMLHGCSRDEPKPQAEQAKPREEFHAARPIRLEVSTANGAETFWLEHELRNLLNRGQMRLVPPLPAGTQPATQAFTLRINVGTDGKQAALALIAPDGVVDRESTLPLSVESRLAKVQAFAAALPRFLTAAHTSTDWVALIGTDDAMVYETFLATSLQWLGPEGQGFTQPPAQRRSAPVERLENLVRRQPRYARAFGALATGYLSLGGEDETSLTQLAQSSAERALALDETVSEAHAALGLAHLRRNEWLAARERFARALELDVTDPAALEGLACLLADAGHYQAAEPIAARAVLLQPRNVGARECLAYARTGGKQPQAHPDSEASPQAAQVHALEAILGGDQAAARELLRSSMGAPDFGRWADPLLRASADRRHIPEALQAVTLAASERHIDPSTEILCGAALRQPEFVFNRMSRLQRQGERLPLRVLWMPQTQFLRKHARFEQIVSKAGLPAFWQEDGVPDVCAAEPALYGCKLRPHAKSRAVSAAPITTRNRP